MTPRAALVCVSILALAAAAACVEPATAPSHYAPYSQVDLVIGTGTEATTGKTVFVNYTGWLYDSTRPDFRGAQFDSSVGQATTFSFVLGSNQVISGWEQGVPGMKVGGTRQLIVPPSLGYGSERRGRIPPAATLIFEITVVDVQ